MAKLNFGSLDDMIEVNTKSSTGLIDTEKAEDLNKPISIKDSDIELGDDLIDLDLLHQPNNSSEEELKNKEKAKDSNGEDASKAKGNNQADTSDDGTSSSPFIQFAKVFDEEGLLDFDEDKFKELSDKLGNPALAIVELANTKVESIINKYKEEAEEDYKKFIEARDLGLDMNSYSSINVELNRYKSITEEDLEFDESKQKMLVTQYLKHKGIEDDDIKDTIESYEDTNKLEVRAKKALAELIKIKEKDIENLKEDTIKQQKQEEEAIKKSVEDFTKVVDSTDELLGIQLTKQLKNKIKQSILSKHSTINGVGVNAVNAKKAENPIKYAMIEALLVEQGVFDGKNLDIFNKKAKTDAIKALEESVNKDSHRSTSKGIVTQKPTNSWEGLKF